MTERELLTDNLIQMHQEGGFKKIAKFIEADRKRICGPLEKVISSDWGGNSQVVRLLSNAIEETLKLAGLGD